jgi:hypothetical protein
MTVKRRDHGRELDLIARQLLDDLRDVPDLRQVYDPDAADADAGQAYLDAINTVREAGLSENDYIVLAIRLAAMLLDCQRGH